VDRTTGTIKLKAEFKNTDRRLWPGQFINVALTLRTQSDAVVVPSEAVQVGQDGQHVFVIKPDKSVEVRPVVVARTDEGEAVVAQRIKSREENCQKGQVFLSPRSRVDIRDANATEAGGQKQEKGERRKSKAQERSAS